MAAISIRGLSIIMVLLMMLVVEGNARCPCFFSDNFDESVCKVESECLEKNEARCNDDAAVIRLDFLFRYTRCETKRLCSNLVELQYPVLVSNIGEGIKRYKDVNELIENLESNITKLHPCAKKVIPPMIQSCEEEKACLSQFLSKKCVNSIFEECEERNEKQRNKRLGFF